MKRGFIIIFMALFLVGIIGCSSNPSDKEDCEKLDDGLKKWNCFHDVAVETSNEDLCLNIPYKGPKLSGESAIRISCIENVATKKQDETICGLIKESDETNLIIKSTYKSCIQDVGIAKKDAKVCLILGVDDHLCINEVADKTNDVSQCEVLRDSKFFSGFGDQMVEDSINSCKKEALEK